MSAYPNILVTRYRPTMARGGPRGLIYSLCLALLMFNITAIYKIELPIICEFELRTPFNIIAVNEYAAMRHESAVVLKFIYTVASAQRP